MRVEPGAEGRAPREESAARRSQRFASAAALATGMLGAALALGSGSPTLVGLGVLAGAAATGLVVRTVIAGSLQDQARVLETLASLLGGDATARAQLEALPADAPLREPLERCLAAVDARREGRWRARAEVARRLADLETGLETLERERREQCERTAERAAGLEALAERLAPERALVPELGEMVEEASSSVLEMATSIDEVARRVDALHRAVDAASASVLEISASLEQVGDSADSVEGMAEESAASMVEMDRAIQEVGEHVRQASTLTERVSDEAETGAQAMGSTLDGIEQIRAVTREASEALGRLEARIAQIGAIVGVISDINDETHLLSLNAAIIAAQAGEQGHAFAVVAGHVKTLARRTAASTQEIAELIRAVQGETADVVRAMGSGAEAVATGVERARRAGDALHDIRRSAHEANARVVEITRAAAEQTRNSAHVAEAAQRTSVMVQQITSALAEQRRAGNHLRESSETALELCAVVRRATAEELQAGHFVQERIASISGVIAQLAAPGEPAGAREALAEAVSAMLDEDEKARASFAALRDGVAGLRRAVEEAAAAG